MYTARLADELCCAVLGLICDRHNWA